MNGRYKNFFFSNFGTVQEQNLLESLIIESIGIYGEDLYYIPRDYNNYDPLFTADDQSSYTKVFPLVMYIDSFDKFGGQGDVISKFGLEIKDQVIFTVAKKIFQEQVAIYTNQLRPNEGDLIYFPLNRKCFQIKYVDKFEVFFQLGKLYTWKMTTELFEYSNELISTGIPEIDGLQIQNDTNILDYVITDETGNYLLDMSENYITTESFIIQNKVQEAINDVLANNSNQIISFDQNNPFGE